MKTRTLTMLLALMAMIAVACGGQTETSTVTGDAPATETEPEESDTSEAAETDEAAAEPEDTEETVELSRIVSLNPTATEMLFAIGAGDQIVAVDEFSYYPPEAPVTDLSGWDPNMEAIAGYMPDVVVTESAMDALAPLGIDNHVIPAAANLDDVYAQIMELGVLTGHEDEAETVVTDMRSEIDAVLAILPERETPLTYYHELDDTLYSATSETFVGYVYSLLGLENVADAADPEGAAWGYPQLNAEYIVDADPDIIFLADTLCCAQDADAVAARPGWENLSAVTNGNVVELNDDIVSRWGPRLVEFIQVAGSAVADL